MVVQREISRPSLANQARGMRTLQPLPGRLAYLANGETREAAWLQDERGNYLTEAEALEHLGGPERSYREAIWAPSVRDCEALCARWPDLDRHEVAAKFGRELGAEFGQGRPVVLAIHFEANGAWHYHGEITEEIAALNRKGEVVVDRNGETKPKKFDGMGGHLDEAWLHAWANSRPRGRRPNRAEGEQLKAAQGLNRAERKVLSDERLAVKRRIDDLSAPIRHELNAAKSLRQGFDRQRELESKLAEIVAVHHETLRENWRREADLEYKGDLLYLRRQGYTENSLEAECAKQRAEMRLVARENGISGRRERADELNLEAGRGDGRLKDMPIEERAPVRESDYARALEAVEVRFKALHRDLDERLATMPQEAHEEERRAFRHQEVDARAAAHLRLQIATLRDQQEALKARMTCRPEREALKSQKAAALETAKASVGHLPVEEQEKALKGENRRIEGDYRAAETALRVGTWEARQEAFAEAVVLLNLRHELDRETATLEASVRGRELSQNQIDRQAERHQKDALWLEASWLQERANMAKIHQEELFKEATQSGELAELAERKVSLEAQAKELAEQLPEGDRDAWLRAEKRAIAREMDAKNRELLASQPSLDGLRAASEERLSLERAADQARAGARGKEWDAAAFEKGADDAARRAETANDLRRLRLEESALRDVVRDGEWVDAHRRDKPAEEARAEAAKSAASARETASRADLAKGDPAQADRLQKAAEREGQAAAQREERQIRRERLAQEQARFRETIEGRQAALRQALEIQSQRHILEMESRRAEAERRGQEWDGASLEAKQPLERRRLEASWHDLEASREDLAQRSARERATAQEALDAQAARAAVERQALHAEAGARISGLALGSIERELAEREMRLQERQMAARHEQEEAEVRRAAPKEAWEEAARALGARQGAELRAAMERAREEDGERIADLKKAHAQQANGLLEGQLLHEAALVRDEHRALMAQATGRAERLALEEKALEAERKASPKELQQTRQQSRKAEWEYLVQSRASRDVAFQEAQARLAAAQTLEIEAMRVKGRSEPRKGDTKTWAERAEALAGCHAIERNSAEIEHLRANEKEARGGLEFGKFRDRAANYREALTSMNRRHTLEGRSLELRMDLKGLKSDAPERLQAGADLKGRQDKDREGLQKAASRTQRGKRGRVPVKGKGLLLEALRDGMAKLREEHDKATKSRASNAADRAGGGFVSAGITVVQTAVKATVNLAEQAAKQAVLQAQHAMRAVIVAAKAAAVAVVNPMAGLKAAGSGLGEVAKDSAKDALRGTKGAAVGLGRDTAQGAKTATKQVGSGILGLAGPGSAEAKAVVGMAKEAVATARKIAAKAVAAVRSALTGNVLGVAKAGLGAGLAVGQGALGVAREGGAVIAKKLPMPIDKALSLLGKVPILGTVAQAAKLGGELGHGAASNGLEIDR